MISNPDLIEFLGMVLLPMGYIIGAMILAIIFTVSVLSLVMIFLERR